MNVKGVEELGPWKLKVDSIDLKYIYMNMVTVSLVLEP
jgi:hypothetical protein